jgi:hypothetical protein
VVLLLQQQLLVAGMSRKITLALMLQTLHSWTWMWTCTP